VADAGRYIFEQALPSFVTRGRHAWLAGLGGIFVASLIAVFYVPGVALPDQEDFQLFPSHHYFERYELEFKRQFGFERAASRDVSMRMPLRFVWGLVPTDDGDALDPESRGQVAMDPLFDPATADAQRWLLRFCQEVRSRPFFAPSAGPSLSNCYIQTFRDWMDRRCRDELGGGGDRSPCCQASRFPFAKNVHAKCLVEAVEHLYETPTDLWMPGVAGPKFNLSTGQPAAVVIEYDASQLFTFSHAEMERFYEQVKMEAQQCSSKSFFKVNDWFSDYVTTAPPELRGGFFTSYLGFYDVQNQLLVGTSWAACIALATAAIVLGIATRSLALAFAAVVSVAAVTASSVACLLVMGWKLNVLESVAVTLIIGMSVDFTLHYAVAYRKALIASGARKKSRSLWKKGDAPLEEGQNVGEEKEKMKEASRSVMAAKSALAQMSAPIAMAAVTTLSSGACLLPSRVLAYVQIGTFIVIVMACSFIFSTFFFHAMLIVFSPGVSCGGVESGEERPFVKALKRYIFGDYGVDSSSVDGEEGGGDDVVDDEFGLKNPFKIERRPMFVLSEPLEEIADENPSAAPHHMNGSQSNATTISYASVSAEANAPQSVETMTPPPPPPTWGVPTESTRQMVPQQQPQPPVRRESAFQQRSAVMTAAPQPAVAVTSKQIITLGYAYVGERGTVSTCDVHKVSDITLVDGFTGPEGFQLHKKEVVEAAVAAAQRQKEEEKRFRRWYQEQRRWESNGGGAVDGNEWRATGGASMTLPMPPRERAKHRRTVSNAGRTGDNVLAPEPPEAYRTEPEVPPKRLRGSGDSLASVQENSRHTRGSTEVALIHCDSPTIRVDLVHQRKRRQSKEDLSSDRISVLPSAPPVDVGPRKHSLASEQQRRQRAEDASSVTAQRRQRLQSLPTYSSTEAEPPAEEEAKKPSYRSASSHRKSQGADGGEPNELQEPSNASVNLRSPREKPSSVVGDLIPSPKKKKPPKPKPAQRRKDSEDKLSQLPPSSGEAPREAIPSSSPPPPPPILKNAPGKKKRRQLPPSEDPLLMPRPAPRKQPQQMPPPLRQHQRHKKDVPVVSQARPPTPDLLLRSEGDQRTRRGGTTKKSEADRVRAVVTHRRKNSYKIAQEAEPLVLVERRKSVSNLDDESVRFQERAPKGSSSLGDILSGGQEEGMPGDMPQSSQSISQDPSSSPQLGARKRESRTEEKQGKGKQQSASAQKRRKSGVKERHFADEPRYLRPKAEIARRNHPSSSSSSGVLLRASYCYERQPWSHSADNVLSQQVEPKQSGEGKALVPNKCPGTPDVWLPRSAVQA